jgi:large subunit ribosomal protein L31
MKKEIHPKYTATNVVCACGNKFLTGSCLGETFKVDICNVCHPFFTGQQKVLDTEGRVDRFRRKYSKTPAAATK